jgi:Xaa-Pro aminopeptidase
MQGIRNTIATIFRLVFLVLFFFSSSQLLQESKAQQNFYDTDLLTSQFHLDRRNAFRALMPQNSIAVFFANPIRNRSNDVDFQYSQDPDLYYLTGLKEPHSALVLFSSPLLIDGASTNELLFIQNRDSASETWTGKRLGKEGALELLNFKSVFINKDFLQFLPDLSQFDKIMVKFPTDIRESKSSKTTLNSMVVWFREAMEKSGKEVNGGALLKNMATLREIKLPEELVLLQKAIDVSNAGLSEAIKALKPGMTEFQAQAVVEFYFRYGGAEYQGYESIGGSGANSCVLHYATNRKKLFNNDLLLMDMGAEYHGYTADITRTIPVNGTFSPEQKIIYDLVFEAQEAGIKAARSGSSFYDPHKAATAVIAKGLVKLGIIADESGSRKFFNHGTSHYLGLEVHDPGNYGLLKPNMVITVEPGIYIPSGSKCDKKWWNIGVRIEDDILITDNEPVVMSGKLPRKAFEIEKLMGLPSLFEQIK